ncbi:MAG: hypothetical protein HY846_06215 [Nitrosomonadales bacterium]|nr:hypothetical protein [Nitrosomonadales bacterium]
MSRPLKRGKQAIREADARKVLDGRSSKLAWGSFGRKLETSLRSFSGFSRNDEM